MNKPVLIAGIAVLVAAIAFFFLFARSEPGERSLAPLASGPAGNPDAAELSGDGPSEFDQIPPQFQGVWAPDRLSCTTRGETARVSISAEEMAFYESRGRLAQVTPLSGGREYAITLDMTGEGESWSRTLHLRRVGHELAFQDAEDPEERLFIRC